MATNPALFSAGPAISSTGALTYTPAANANGTTSISVTPVDNGGILNGGANTGAVETFDITVNSVNDAPTLTAIPSPAAILEDAAQQTINLAGITSGAANESQTLVVTATSSNTALIPDPTVTYTSANATGSLAYTPVADANGSATITVTVNDGGGGTETIVRTFTVAVTAVNDQPTLAAIATPADILEDAIQQTVNLTGIGKGPANESSQVLAVTASSSNTALIPTPTVVYTPSDATGSIKYTPAANLSGTSTITVTVTDTGGTSNSGVNTVSRTFVVTVTAVNDAPTLTAITDRAAILEDATLQTVSLAGIGKGATNESAQILAVTASSDNTALIPNPTVVYTPSGTTGSITYTPVANMSGTANVTVTVTDDGDTLNSGVNTFSRTFLVTVTSVNDQPTLTTIPTPAAILEDAAEQTINLAGISSGAANELQTLVVTATSSNTALIPNPTVTYASADTTGSLAYTPLTDANGSAIITVTVNDAGGGTQTIVRTFTVAVTGVNDAPAILVAPSNPAAVNEDSGAQTVLAFINIAGVNRGGTLGNESTQTLTFTVTNNNNALFSTQPAISGSTGNLTFTPSLNAHGSASVTVIPKDNGLVANGGIDSGIAQIFTITVDPVNDVPSFTIPDTAITGINEDAATTTIPAFATSILTGGGSTPETADTLTFNVTVTVGASLFVGTPTINATTGALTFTPAANQNGVATLEITLSDDGTPPLTTAIKTATVTINAINDEPFFTADLPTPVVTIDESDAGQIDVVVPNFLTVGYIAGINRGGGTDEATQTLTTYTCTIADDQQRVLFYNGSVTIDAAGTLRYQRRIDAFGTATVVVTVRDSGSNTAPNDAIGSVTKSFQIVLTPVNDTPTYTFASGSSHTVLEDAGAKTIPGFIASVFGGGTSGSGLTPLVAYDFRETSDTFAYTVTPVSSTGNLTFTSAPGIAPNGTLTYQTAQDTNGSATFSVFVTDTAPLGTTPVNKTSTSSNFTITVTAVNDAPIAAMDPFAPETENVPPFGIIPVVRVVEDAPAYITLTAPFEYLADGPATATDETTPASAQTISATNPWVIVAGSNTNPALFSVQPDVNVAGNLLFTVAPNVSGSCTVQLQARDSGAGNTDGTPDANGNTRGSNPLTVKIIVEKFNDGPTLTPNATALTINEIAEIDEAAPPTITLNNWITALTTGPGTDPADYQADAISNIQFISTTNSAYFSQQPQIVYDAMNPAASELSFKLAADRFGTATLTVRITDDGLSGVRTVNGVTSTDVNVRDVTVNVVIRNINDAPFLSPNTGLPVVVNEDAHKTTQYNVVWVTPNDGPFESAQIGSFVLTPLSITPNLSFTQNPAINGSTGRLTFKTTPNAYGTVSYSVLFNDNAAVTLDPPSSPLTVDGGTLTITVNPLNDAPVLTLGASQTINEDEGAQTVTGFLTGLLPGPLNELDPPEEQTMTIAVTNNANALFDVQPDITLSALPGPQTGVLTYTPKANAKGLVTVTVTVTDSGPNGGGNVNSTAPTFQILINILPEISTVAATATATTATTATTEVRQARATLRGELTPEGVYAAAMFQYGITSDLTGTDTLETPVSLTSSAAGDLPAFVSVSQLVTNLLPGTQYYYRAIATNEYGTVTAGTIETFTTLQPMWTWVGGSNGQNGSGTALGIGISNAFSTPPSRQGAGSWTSGGKQYILGGVSPSSTGHKRNDLWEYDPSTSRWIWRSGSVTDNAFSDYGTPGAFTAGATPGARHTMMCWVSPTTGNLFLFGGFSPAGRCNDLWEYNVLLNQWKWIDTAGTPGVDEAGDYVDGGDGVYPGGRQGGATWTDPVTGEFWLFGGTAPSIPGNSSSLVVFNDLWMYDGSWNFMGGPTVAGNAGSYPPAPGGAGTPPARRDACTWVDRSGQFWLFGGQKQGLFAGGTGYLNDLWKYNSGTNVWTWVKGSSTPDVIASVKGASGVLDAANTPNSRSSPGTVSMPDGTLLMFGGISGTATFYNEIWRWDWVTEQWAWIRGGISMGNYGTKGEGDVARTPGGRFTPSVFAGTNNETLWVFGGGGSSATGNGRLADLWRYDFAPLPQDKYDTDTDGLDDLWEITYFGDTTTVVNGNADADGDGQSNAYEEVSGTNPNNILSLLTSTATIVSGVPYMDYSAVKPNVTYELSKTSPLPVEVLSRAAFPTTGTGRVLDTTRKLLSAPTTQTAITDTAP